MPGSSRDEGTFLITAADDGSRAVYFIAGNARHGILQADLQLETQLNPLWPVRQASRDEALGIVEGSPIGSARVGLLSGPAPASEAVVETPAVDQPIAQPTPAQAIAQPAVEQPGAPQPVAEQPAVAQPVIDQPLAAQPAVAQPVVDQPVAALPASAQPGVAQPAVEQPVASQPGAEQPLVAQPISDTSAEQTTYVLQPGDNLTRLAERYNTSVQAILAANRVTNANVIYVGKSLVIPTASAQATPVEEPALVADIPQAKTAPVADVPQEKTAPVKDVPHEKTAPVADVPQEETAPVADVPQAAPTTYTVRAGDSAIGIARQFGVDLDTLLAANNVADRNRVFVGIVLVIPGAAGPAPVADDTTKSLAAVMPEESAAPTASTTYTVRAGDSAVGIARQFGVDLDTLLAANHVADRNRVLVGQVLTIPSSES